jgi:DHA2 family multidrug resistance protein-like MFS transporter
MASGIAETSSELGGALGIAVLGSFITVIYRSRMSGEQLAGIPGETVEAARRTLASAAAAAHELPKKSDEMLLLTTAQDAFALGFSWVAAMSAVLALAGALLIIRVARSTVETTPGVA